MCFSRPPLRCGNAARRRPRCPGGCRAARPPPCSIFSSRRWWSAAKPTGMRRIRCRPISCPKAFRTNRSTNPVARYWKAMTSGGSTGRPKVILDHQPAVIDTAADRRSACRSARRCSIPARSITTRRSSCRTLRCSRGGRVTGIVKFDAEETLRLIEANRVQWVNFVPTMMHRIWALPDEVRNRYDLSSLQIVFHMAAPMPPWLKEKWIEWLGPERIYELYGGTERQGATIISGVEWLAHQRLGRQDRRNLAPAHHRRGRQRGRRRARPARSISCPMTAPAAPIIISAPSRSAAPTAGNRSAISAGSMPTAISISATGSPT